ncbi:HD domain-containing protein [Paenibacillus sp. YYML68]|uniref:HD domain-containing protein n=1 Tax=Paenibacillus sp. YYML68 TaxID=2909250 RepID=UPI002491201A|nr:HD domain-containing protein [Paenibacillus sp. YYML68]
MSLSYIHSPVLQAFNEDTIWEPLYRLHVTVTRCERELFQNDRIRRLKHIHHYGAGALISPVIHSRLEHTIGVWALSKRFFPEWPELHIACILHDIGHLPFSHTLERTLHLSHHSLTEQAIQSASIQHILRKHGFSEQSIIDLLHRDTPLSPHTDGLGLDHLDSFLRDTHSAGLSPAEPSSLIERVDFYGNVVETDEATALQLIEAIVDDHQLFLSSSMLAADALLCRATNLYLMEEPSLLEQLPNMGDRELLTRLQHASNVEIRDIHQALLYAPHRIVSCEQHEAGAIEASVRKIYSRQPYVQHKPIEQSKSLDTATSRLEALQPLVRTIYCRLL